jgi:hypothetical protein
MATTGGFLTYLGWAYTENGNVGIGRPITERAINSRRENGNAAHALSRAMFEGGSIADAEAFLADWLPIYDRGGILHGHISWHQALLALEQGVVLGTQMPPLSGLWAGIISWSFSTQNGLPSCLGERS